MGKFKPLRLFFLALLSGLFFLGSFFNHLEGKTIFSSRSVIPKSTQAEVFGFAPYWTLSKLSSVDWDVLTTFAYFSLPVSADGTISRDSYEWRQFDGDKLTSLFETAKKHNVRRVITLTQMEAGSIEEFLNNEDAWKTAAEESTQIIKDRGLEGVNIDFEYMGEDDFLKQRFSDFVDVYSNILRKNLKNPYITVSVLASSVRFNKIYDVGRLSKSADALFMMAYDFYYPGSETIGPVAPLYGYNNGKGPFWYDVSTAVDDFLKVADSKKIIMGVPYYGWNYPANTPMPKTGKKLWTMVEPTTYETAQTNPLLSTTPIGGWDKQAQMSWRGYWDDNGWHVVYLEDKNSLSAKYEFAKKKNLGGVGIWALGFDGDEKTLWSALKNNYKADYLTANTN